jgi:D-hexose-6-phosphate mutarotase
VRATCKGENRRRMVHELQKKFDAPGIQFLEGNGGLTKIVIGNAAAEAEVYLHGAHLTHYQPRGGQPLLWMSSRSAFASGKPIRGGVPICWPWFGAKPDDAKAPMHGFARISDWNVEAASRIDDQRTSVTLRLESNDATRKLWPYEFVARFTISVGAALELSLETTNKSRSGLVLSEALHSYFYIGDITQVSLGGLTGTTYFDKVHNARKIEERDPVKLSGETDSVYLNTRSPIRIDDSVTQRKIRIEKSGSNSTVVWNPFQAKAQTLSDVGAGEWKQFICVEAVNALENSVTLAPGATHTIRASVKVL